MTMLEGLLWLDTSARRSQAEKLAEAAARYAERFGRKPNCCHVNPAQAFVDAELTIVPNSAVLPHHFWVGQDESVAAPRRAKRSA